MEVLLRLLSIRRARKAANHRKLEISWVCKTDVVAGILQGTRNVSSSNGSFYAESLVTLFT